MVDLVVPDLHVEVQVFQFRDSNRELFLLLPIYSVMRQCVARSLKMTSLYDETRFRRLDVLMPLRCPRLWIGVRLFASRLSFLPCVLYHVSAIFFNKLECCICCQFHCFTYIAWCVSVSPVPQDDVIVWRNVIQEVGRTDVIALPLFVDGFSLVCRPALFFTLCFLPCKCNFLFNKLECSHFLVTHWPIWTLSIREHLPVGLLWLTPLDHLMCCCHFLG